MRVFGLSRQVYQAARLAGKLPELSLTAQERLAKVQAIDRLRAKGLSPSEAAPSVGISRATYFRWKKLLKAGPARLEPRSRRPKRSPPPSVCTPELTRHIEALRQQNPQWGKAKLAVLLGREGLPVSVSSTGRCLTKLFRRGVLLTVPQLRRGASARRAQRRRPHAQRLKAKPVLTTPGQLVQVDTLSITLTPGVVVKQFTASCPVSRFSVAQVYSRATASCAAKFLDFLQKTCPFPLQALQVNGGSEFKAEFEAACQEKTLPLYVLPPRSPKLNGSVERCNGSYRYEFWHQEDLPLTLNGLRQKLAAFQHTFNAIRPHQSLHYLTPLEYLHAHFQKDSPESHMS